MPGAIRFYQHWHATDEINSKVEAGSETHPSCRVCYYPFLFLAASRIQMSAKQNASWERENEKRGNEKH